ncbi:MAG: flippase [Candidatus Kerfeldbacteria bacterium]|nr:flippase [Candidatus Kerfeldbacteria bacterium]
MNKWSSIWLVSGELISRALAFIVVVRVANYLGATAYGELSYVLAMASVLVIIADFGLSTFVVTHVSRHDDDRSIWLSQVFIIKGLLGIGMVLLAVVVGLVLPNVSLLLMVLAAGAIWLNNSRMFIEACFRAYQRMPLETFTKILAAVISLIIISLGVYWQTNVLGLIITYVIAAVLGTTAAGLVLVLKVTRLQFVWSKKSFQQIIMASWPFAISIACNFLFNYEDAALLGIFKHTTALGWYTAAYKPIFVITALAGMIINAFLPTIVTAYQQNNTTWRTTIQQLFATNIALALPLAAGGTIIAQPLIGLLFKADFAPAALAFQILIWGTATIYLWAVFGNSLQAIGQELIYTRAFGWGVLLNTGLNLVLIPTWSLYGAALATVITQLFLLGYLYYFFRKHIKVPVWLYSWRPLIATAVMVVVLQLVPADLWWQIGLGVITYVVVLYCVGGLTPMLWPKSPS